MNTRGTGWAAVKDTLRRDIGRVWRGGVVHIGASRFLAQLTGLAQRVLLARILGAENIGHIAVVSAALSLIRLPAGVGTFTVVNKLVAENNGDLEAQKEVVGTSLAINLVTALLVGACTWLILRYTDWVADPVANHLLGILIFLLPLMIFSEVLQNALMGQRRMRTVAGINMTLALTAIVIVVPMAYVWSLHGWFVNQVLIIFLGFGLLVWKLRKLLSLRWNGAVGKRVAVIGGFAFLGQLVGTLVLQFDTLAIGGILKDAAATGIYNTASLVVQQLVIVPGAILTVAFPVVAQNRDNRPRLKELYWELFRKVGLVALGLSGLMWAICPWFFPIFGQEFAASVGPFRVLVLGVVARSLYVLDNTYMDALGRTDITFFSGLLAAAAAIALNLLIIPVWGTMGAAWATTFSVFFSLAIRQGAVHYFIFRKHALR